MLIRSAEVGGSPSDVRLSDGRIAQVEPSLAPVNGEVILEGRGGALLPGLHDHHLHLCALAASLDSVRCGPPHVEDREGLGRALRAAPPGRAGWVRGTGYCEVVAGDLDRDALDSLRADGPVRVQHRSGALWIVNSAGAERLALDTSPEPGVERDVRGRPTGRLFGLDTWLRDRIGGAWPDLSAVGRLLASFGVTGVTDATQSNGEDALLAFARACDAGALPQRVRVMGTHALPASPRDEIARGEVKLVLAERALPSFEALREQIAAAHRSGRAVAIHCVTRAELVLALEALRLEGGGPADRIEHGGVIPPDTARLLADLGPTVVTQPNFIAERGDEYRADVDPRDLPWLYRCRGLARAGIPLAAGTDAPFGDPDPWRAMRAAVDRRTRSGAPLGPDEAVTPEDALALFSAPLEAPGERPRAIEPGAPADLCLLDRSWKAAREALSSETVRATLRSGRVVFEREGG